MRGKTFTAPLILALGAVIALAAIGAIGSAALGTASAQERHAVPTYQDIYCSGAISTEAVPRDTYVTTGEESNYKVTFQEGDYVYLNKGSRSGVKVGDEFSVVRPVRDLADVEWTKWQSSILKKLGTWWEDEGRLRVVVAQPDASITQVIHACNYLQRGDVAVPFVERATPPLKTAAFDRFAPPSGKSAAMIISGKFFQQQSGTNDTVYVNLGAAQGVKVGDYFRIFRYQGTQHETAYQTRRFSFDADGWNGIFGFGSVPARYNWENTPREVLGEGVVVRVTTNSSTLLLTFTLREVFAGDYIEIE
jgi:hypothetical protein